MGERSYYVDRKKDWTPQTFHMWAFLWSNKKLKSINHFDKWAKTNVDHKWNQLNECREQVVVPAADVVQAERDSGGGAVRVPRVGGARPEADDHGRRVRRSLEHGREEVAKSGFRVCRG